jgi:hypothetical protein
MLTLILLSLTSTFIGSEYQNGVVGIKLDLPAEAQVVGTSSHPPFCLISSGKSSITWNLRIEKLPNPAGLTQKEFVSESINSVVAPEGTVTLIDTAPSVDKASWWTVLNHTKQQNQSIIGRFAIPAKGKQMILATLVTNLEGWKYGKDLFIHTLLSMESLDPVALLHDKMAGIDAGTALLASLEEETLRALGGFEEWRRIQRTENDGSVQDIGYAYVAVGLGTMQDIERGKRSTDSSPTGILVTFQSRLVPNLETAVVTDTDATYWMSWDGQEERWSSKITRWVDKIKATTSETGLRNRQQLGSPKPKLLVVTQDLTTSLVEPTFDIEIQNPWLPRALSWVIGPLLASVDSSETFRWWCYDNIGGQKTITRIDSLTIQPNETLLLATQFGEGAKSSTSVFDKDGCLLRQSLDNDITVTGSTKDALITIWAPRNL